MTNPSSEAMEIIRSVLEIAKQQYQFSYEEQLELWAEFLVATAEVSALADQLMQDQDISREEAIELAFERSPRGLKELIKKVNPDKYHSYRMENEKGYTK